MATNNTATVRVDAKLESYNMVPLAAMARGVRPPAGRFLTYSSTGATVYADQLSEFAFLSLVKGDRSDVISIQIDPSSAVGIELDSGGLCGLIGHTTMVGLHRNLWGTQLPVEYDFREDIDGSPGETVAESDMNGELVQYDLGDPVVGQAVMIGANGLPIYVDRFPLGVQPILNINADNGFGYTNTTPGLMYRQFGTIVKVAGPIIWFLFDSNARLFVMHPLARFPDNPSGSPIDPGFNTVTEVSMVIDESV